MTRRSLYRLAMSLCMAGYVWLGASYMSVGGGTVSSPCLFRRIMHLPCPACGTTRAVIALLQGHVAEAVRFNLLGFVALAGLLILPGWLLYDGWSRRDTFYRFYLWLDAVLKRKEVFLSFIILILIIWCVNLFRN